MSLTRKSGCSSILATGLNSRRPHTPAKIRVSILLDSNCREYKFVMLTFRGCSYNKSQRDVLFLKFILIKNSKYFGYIYCPLSGVPALYTQQ